MFTRDGVLQTPSGILYVRAGLRPFVSQIKAAGGVAQFLSEVVEHEEVFVPLFWHARPFWRKFDPLRRVSNTGALGKQIAQYPETVISQHPSHPFAGIGNRVGEVLRMHNHTRACFFPVDELARRHDFSMLLLGCVDESPGFSTVHAVQQELGLTQRHMIRWLLRWDFEDESGWKSIIAPESPGCSMSFDKFYTHYEKDGNLIRGELFGQRYLYVKSASRAMDVEREILSRNPRFVDCKRLTCSTCRFRLY